MCGRITLTTPAELTCDAALQQVDGVAWLPIAGVGATTYLAVDRPVRVALTVPDGVGTGAWQELSKLIGSTLRAGPVCSDGRPVPVDGG